MRSPPCRAASVWRLLLAPTLAVAAPEAAGQPALGLRWSDPHQLAPSTEQDFDARLTERLGHPAFSGGPVAHTLSVSWRGSREQCQVELSLVHETRVEGTRRIESPSGDCASLEPALLTVAALLVEARQRAFVPEPEAPIAVPAPTNEPPPPPPPAPAARERPEPVVLASLGGSLSAGFVPKVELGPAAVVTWSPFSHLRVGLEGALFLSHQYGTTPGLSLDHDRAAVLVCGMPWSGSFGWGLCGNVALHHFGVSGISLPYPATHDLTTWSAGAAMRAEWRLAGRLWWVGHVGVDVPTRPLYFYYVTAALARKKLFEQRHINPSLLLALSLELP